MAVAEVEGCCPPRYTQNTHSHQRCQWTMYVRLQLCLQQCNALQEFGVLQQFEIRWQRPTSIRLGNLLFVAQDWARKRAAAAVAVAVAEVARWTSWNQCGLYFASVFAAALQRPVPQFCLNSTPSHLQQDPIMPGSSGATTEVVRIQ